MSSTFPPSQASLCRKVAGWVADWADPELATCAAGITLDAVTELAIVLIVLERSSSYVIMAGI